MQYFPWFQAYFAASLLAILALTVRLRQSWKELDRLKPELEKLQKLKKEQLSTDAADMLADMLSGGSTVVRVSRINPENLLLWHGSR